MEQSGPPSESGDEVTYRSQAEIANALNAESLAQLSVGQLDQLFRMMPRVDPEMAKEMLKQYPELKAQVLEGLGVFRDTYAATLSSNDKSQDHAYRAIDRTMDMLQGQLDKDGNSAEDQRYLVDTYMATMKTAVDMDGRNKKFLDTGFGKVLLTTAIGVGLGALVFAPKLISGSNSSIPRA